LPTQTLGGLLIDNGGNFGATTPLSEGTYTFDALELIRGASLEILSSTTLNWPTDEINLDDAGIALHGKLISSNSTEFASINLITGAKVIIYSASNLASVGAVNLASDSSLILKDSSQLACSEITISSESNVTVNDSARITSQNVLIQSGGEFILNNSATFPGMHIAEGGKLSADSWLKLEIRGDLTIDAGGSISVDGKGYGLNSGPGVGGFIPDPSAPYDGGGAGYGEFGGQTMDVPGGSPYGSVAEPIELGSGGGGNVFQTKGGVGGGAIRLDVNGMLAVNGSISANGTDGFAFKALYWGVDRSGGGSGGSIFITAGTFTGGGTIESNGGNGGTGWADSAGGGSGGRIAVYSDTNMFTGTMLASGGAGNQPGGVGTIRTGNQIFITPNKGGDTGSVTVNVQGRGFIPGASVKLIRDSDELSGNPVSVSENGKVISTSFDLMGKSRGL